ncbi:MAG: hypothetical protein NTY35_11595 [Planctomycetota bacterium]|nr:hypothetical protein [Planctomycetota bacterium]
MILLHPALRRSLAFCASAAICASAAFAQGDNGFLRGTGHSDIVLTFNRDSYDEFWVGNDKVSDPAVGKVTRDSYALYAAYGLRDDMDLVFSGSYVKAESDGNAGFEDESDLQDAYLGAKWRFWTNIQDKHGFALLFAPSVKLPMTDYEDNAVTAIGDGQVDLRGRLIAHYQMANGFYAALESGYDVRNGAPKDEVPLNLSVGATFGMVTLTPFYSRVFSQGGPDIGAPGFTFPSVQEEYSRVGLGAYVRIGDGFGLTGMWRTTIDGLNTGDVESFSLGLVVRF